MEDRFYRPLLESITFLPVIDCHEHTYLPEQRPMPVDVWTLLRNSDVGDDLISAGMPPEDRPFMDWRRVSPYLSAVQNTGFYRSLAMAFQELFGFEGDQLTAENWPELSQAIQDANDRPDWYAEVLQRRGNISLVMRVQGVEADPFSIDRRFFAPLILVDDWILIAGAEAREQLAERVGGTAGTLSEYLDALEAAIHQAKARQAVGLKSMLAYRRTIAHDRPERGEIEVLYGKLHRSRVEELAPAEERAYEDFMMHAAARLAGEYQLPIQIHVGYGSWQSNITAQANPILLNPLIEAHRQTKFVLLHGGYPFIGEMATLAKNHPNIFIEAGWLAYIAPAAYRRAMTEWLDSVPCNKILAFSADCLHIEQTFGALLLTRQLLAQCLTEKIESAGWDMGFCNAVARRLLSENASALYQLESVTEYEGEIGSKGGESRLDFK